MQPPYGGGPGGYAPPPGYPQQPQQQPMAPMPQPQPQPPPPSPMAAVGLPKGFFGSLFDFSFSSFVTTKIVRFLFGLMVLLLALGTIGGLVAAILRIVDDVIPGLLMLIAVPIAALIYLILIRIYMELLIVIFRIAETLESIDRKTRG